MTGVGQLNLKVLVAVLASVLSASGAAGSAVLRFKAVLDGANETPPNSAISHGLLSARLDTTSGVFDYRATYARLSGRAEIAEFDGPNLHGDKVSPVLTAAHFRSPIRGSAFLNDGQIGDLMAETWYFNIHTKAYPAGEIRGRLVAVH
jgi:hypothetical protein